MIRGKVLFIRQMMMMMVNKCNATQPSKSIMCADTTQK